MAAAPAREAATVLLLRDGPAGIETWLLRRVPKMPFAPGMSVFPGGGVDPVDADGERCAREDAVASQLRVPAEHAAKLLRTAAREICEETDVRLPLEQIYPWARWITPEAEPRRYDTYFFVAVLPAGAVAAAVTGEASHADWISVEQALAEYRAGERPMLPPTVFNLIEIARFGTAAEVLAAAGHRVIEPIQPSIRALPDGTYVAELGN
ncbi:MAG: NUDIX hydrolase, partial [Jatrophihabitantaceae bacterium]